MTSVRSYSHNVSGEREFGFAQAIKVGETIYVSGQLSHDDEGNFVHASDFDAQAKQTFANLDKVLDHFGVTRNQVVQDTVFVVNLLEHNKAVAAAHLEYFGKHRPTSTTVGAEGPVLPRPAHRGQRHHPHRPRRLTRSIPVAARLWAAPRTDRVLMEIAEIG